MSEERAVNRSADERIPSDLLLGAVQTFDGEYGWTLVDAEAVASVLADVEVGLLGGEAWLVAEDGRLYGMIPSWALIADEPSHVFAWSAEPAWQTKSESWAEYCRRAATHTLSMLALARKWQTQEVHAEYSGCVRYNLTYVTREEYLALSPGCAVFPDGGFVPHVER
jgi:hypothetical protein